MLNAIEPSSLVSPDLLRFWKEHRYVLLLLFDSYLPHRSGPNRSQSPRRALYVTYNRTSEGDVRDAYFDHKRRTFPPEIEREPGKPLSEEAQRYNLGNPIR
jgi:ectoine hydroxylase-related dioxygenase (phytanoyl-CoA dioxygenase family)